MLGARREQDLKAETSFGDIKVIAKAVAKDDISVLLNNADWKKDMGEISRRVYDWWRMLLNDKSGSLPKFRKVVKLIALLQLSSAFVERVVSQLAFICRTIGNSTSRYVMELRTLIRVNNGLIKD